MKNTEYILIFAFSILFNLALGQDHDIAVIQKYNIQSIETFSHLSSNGKERKSSPSQYYIYDINGHQIEKFVNLGTIRKTTYEYDSLGNLMRQIGYDKNGNKTEVSYREYNQNKTKARADTSFLSNSAHVENFIYNDQNQIIEVKSHNGRGTYNWHSYYKYYDSGEIFEKTSVERNQNFIRIERFNKKGSIIFKSENGKVDEFWSFDHAAFALSLEDDMQKDTISFTEKGEARIKIIKTSDAKKSVQIIDDLGNVLGEEEYKYDSDHKLSSSEKTRFNDKGQILESNGYFRGGEKACGNSTNPTPDSHYHFKYEYFSNGLIKFVYFYDQNGKKTSWKETVVTTHSGIKLE